MDGKTAGFACKGIVMIKVHNGHALVASFAVQVTSARDTDRTIVAPGLVQAEENRCLVTVYRPT